MRRVDGGALAGALLVEGVGEPPEATVTRAGVVPDQQRQEEPERGEDAEHDCHSSQHRSTPPLWLLDLGHRLPGLPVSRRWPEVTRWWRRRRGERTLPVRALWRVAHRRLRGC